MFSLGLQWNAEKSFQCLWLLQAAVSCPSCPCHQQQGQHWVLAFVTSLPCLLMIQEILLFVNCSLSFLHPVFIVYVTSGQPQMCCPKEHVTYFCVKGMTLLTSDLQNIISRKCPALQMKFSICKFLLVLLSLLMPWESKPWQLMFCCFDVLNNVFCQPSNTILFLWRHLMLQLENLTTSSLYCVEWSVFTFAWPPLAQQLYSSRHQKGNECPTTP